MAAHSHRLIRSGLAAVLTVAFIATVPHRTDASPRAASPALQSCSGIKTGGDFAFGVDQDVVSFDSANTVGNGPLWADMNVYDQLVRLSPDATHLEPDLASSYQSLNGGRTYIFHLRHNAKFWNGTPVTATDVVFSWNLVRNPKMVNAYTLQAVKSISAVNPYTVKIVLKTPWAPFLNDSTLWAASIWSKKAYQRMGHSAFIKKPVGSGPFYVSKFLPGQYVLLKRNKYYWEKDACGKQMPYLNSAKLVYLPNDNTRLVKLQAGEIDAMIDLPYNLISTVNANPNTIAQTTPQFGNYVAALNAKKYPYFADRHVLQAMNYAIDRKAIVRAVFYGHATPANSPISKGLNFYDPRFGYPYNLPLAKKLMAQSKYPHGFKTEFLIASGSVLQQGIAIVMQSELKAIGIKMTVRALDGTTQFATQQKEDYQMAMDAGTFDNLDPNENMGFCCTHTGFADSNYTGWNNPAADALYARSQKEVNYAKRAKLLSTWQKIIMQQLPVLWLVYPSNSFAFRKNVHGFQIQNTAHWDLWTVWKS